MNLKVRTHEIRDEKKKFVMNGEKDRKLSSPLLAPILPHDPNELSSPATSERNLSEIEFSKENSENTGKFQISIEPQREKNEENGKKCKCGKDNVEEIFHDNVAAHVKFDSFDLMRLIGKGSFGQVFMVILKKLLSLFFSLIF